METLLIIYDIILALAGIVAIGTGIEYLFDNQLHK